MALLRRCFPMGPPREFRYYLCSQPAGFHLLELDGRLAGLALVQTHDHSDELWLNVIAVDPAFRGQGVSQRLLALCERDAAERGYRAVGLRCRADNSAALKLYERAQYTRVQDSVDAKSGRHQVVFRREVTPCGPHAAPRPVPLAPVWQRALNRLSFALRVRPPAPEPPSKTTLR